MGCKAEAFIPKEAELKDFVKIVISGKTYKNDIYLGGTGIGNRYYYKTSAYFIQRPFKGLFREAI